MPRLAQPSWRAERFLVSFENSFGVSRHVLIPGDPGYVQLESRLGLWKTLFADREITAFFALRFYDRFLNSASSEAVCARFDQATEPIGIVLADDHLRWPAILDRVRAALSGTRDAWSGGTRHIESMNVPSWPGLQASRKRCCPRICPRPTTLCPCPATQCAPCSRHGPMPSLRASGTGRRILLRPSLRRCR